MLTTDKTYRKEIRSLLGNVSLGWKSMLFADATFRNDWSSTLPANENSYFYPSFSGSFIFTELEPVKAVSWLNFGKVRLGWAQVGNDTDPYSLSRTYEYKNSSFGGVPNYGLDIILNNAHLKPELTNSVEAGIELKLLNNRVGLDLTYYNNLTKNQIMQVPLAASSGYTSQWMNAGEISNKGLEVVLNVVPVQTANFQWEATFNWSKNNNKVEKLNDQLKTLQIASSFVALHATVGKPYGELMGYNYVFDSEGNKVVAANGVYAKTAQTEGLGSVLPDWLGGVRNSFRYKNFDAGFLIDVRKGDTSIPSPNNTVCIPEHWRKLPPMVSARMDWCWRVFRVRLPIMRMEAIRLQTPGPTIRTYRPSNGGARIAAGCRRRMCLSRIT